MVTFTTHIDCGVLGELQAEVTYLISKGFPGSREEPSEDGQLSIQSVTVLFDKEVVELDDSAYDYDDLVGDACWENHWGQ